MKKIIISIIILLMLMSCGSRNSNSVVFLNQHKLMNTALISEYPDASIYWVSRGAYIVNNKGDVYLVKTLMDNNEGFINTIQPIYAREDITLTTNGVATLTIYVGCTLYGDEEYMLYEGDFYKIKVYNFKSADKPLHSIKKLIRIQEGE